MTANNRSKTAELIWKSETCFQIDDANFRRIGFGDPNKYSTERELVIEKPKWLIKRYISLFEKLRPAIIVELGIKQGGSCAFFQKLSRAKKVIAIDIAEQPVEALEAYIKNNNLSQSLLPFFNVDQADREKIEKILDREIGDEGIDLVVDDASHFLEESRQSFNILFPKLRQGGAYIIEDWPWAHATLAFDDDFPAFWPEKEPLTKLVFELLLSLPAIPDLISEIVIDKNSATIWRGRAELDQKDFDISNCSLARGRNLLP